MIDCHHCEHYYVTWDKEFPHGCRAMGFKSAQIPSVTVLMHSDQPCQFYKKKERKKRGFQ